MNKRYSQNDIQKLLKVANKSITPNSAAFDALLSKLDTTLVKPSIQRIPIVSPFSVFKLAGAFTAFALVFLGFRNMSLPLQNTVAPRESAGGVELSKSSEMALGNIVARDISENSASSGSSESPNTARTMSATSLKNSAQSQEVLAIESATLNSLAAESQADSELLALSPEI